MSLSPAQEKSSPMAKNEEKNESGRSEGADLEKRGKACILCNSSTANGKSATQYVGRLKVEI